MDHKHPHTKHSLKSVLIFRDIEFDLWGEQVSHSLCILP